jgi:hypothetical protein
MSHIQRVQEKGPSETNPEMERKKERINCKGKIVCSNISDKGNI